MKKDSDISQEWFSLPLHSAFPITSYGTNGGKCSPEQKKGRPKRLHGTQAPGIAVISPGIAPRQS
jgi:hypothetical protein